LVFKVTLVAAFIPLVFGLYWKFANTQGALFAITPGDVVMAAAGNLPPD